MFTVLRFLLHCIGQFLSKLFTIDIGSMSLGTLFCIISIMFPLLLAIVHFIKTTFVSDLRSDYFRERRQRRAKQ